jgi:lipid-A-disaccharide synthase
MTQSPRILISAGEASGDEHASKVVLALRTLIPNADFCGMGGSHLRSAGVRTIVDSEVSGSVMGFTEVLGSLGRILRAYREMKNLLREWRPQLLIVVDYQDFHFRLMRAAHALNIPVLFFISPSVWAWRSGRVRLVDRYVHTMAAIYPFEPEFYRSRGCNKVVYVGHPLTEEFATEKIQAIDRVLLRKQFLKESQGNPEQKLIVLAPGSRKKEVELLLPILQEVLLGLHARHPNWRYVIPLAAGIPRECFQEILAQFPELQLSEIPAVTLYQIADAGLIKSGTSNLQAAFAGLPFAMMYKMKAVSAAIIKSLTQTPAFSIVNIIRPGTVMEAVQEECSSTRLRVALEQLVENESQRSRMQAALLEVQQALQGYDPRPDFINTSSVAERVAILAQQILTQASASSEKL